IADGLGHGPSARQAAQLFCDQAQAHASAALDVIMGNATRALVHSRGAAAALLRLSPSTQQIEYCGVGNIGLVCRTAAPLRAVSTPGMVGRRAPRIRTWMGRLAPGDLFVLHTDGVASRFELDAASPSVAVEPSQLVTWLLGEHGKRHDDA